MSLRRPTVLMPNVSAVINARIEEKNIGIDADETVPKTPAHTLAKRLDGRKVPFSGYLK